MHTQEHVNFNASAQKYGHDVRSLEQITGRYIQFALKNFSKIVKPFGMTREMVDLTATTALEHFTATIASELLRNKHIQDLMTDETMSYMWFWHAVEENEHKAVAYDVYESVFGTGLKAYSLRTTALVFAMVLIFILQSYFTDCKRIPCIHGELRNHRWWSFGQYIIICIISVQKSIYIL